LTAQVITQFAAGIPAQASGARVLFAMGRDQTLPRKFFSHINTRFKTPINNIIIIGIIGFIALFMDVNSATSFVNFGAFSAFIFVNISVIFHYYINNKKRNLKGTILYLIIPLCGSIINIWLFTYLDKHALILGSSWIILGIIIFILNKKFNK